MIFQISRGYKNTIPDPETLKNKIAELKVSRITNWELL